MPAEKAEEVAQESSAARQAGCQNSDTQSTHKCRVGLAPLRVSALLEDADGTLRESQLARLTETASSGFSGETLPQ